MTKCVFTSVLVFLTGGLFLILLTWRSDIKLNCLYEKAQLKDATKLLLKARIKMTFIFVNGYENVAIILYFLG